jgi:circadian clock protein KaiB
MTTPFTYTLTLFVSGASDLSARAIVDVRRLCDVHLDDRHRLTIVDVRDDPGAFVRSGAIAAPALVRTHPLPVRRVVGDLSDSARTLAALDLLPQAAG